MLVIALVRELLKNTSKESNTIVFFFCQNTDPQLNNAKSILRGLIWKLAINNPQLARVFYETYKSDKYLLNGANATIALFLTLVQMLKHCPGTFLLIDALDECEAGPERDQLLTHITSYAKLSYKVKWLVSSRNYSEIREHLKLESQMLSLELNEQHISQAVYSFIIQKTNELAEVKGYSLELTNDVRRELATKANSTFLWVALACKSLRKVPLWRTFSVLQKMPAGLQPFYRRMMEQISYNRDEEEKDFCFRILRSASLSFRPLSMEELITIADLPNQLLNNNEIVELVDLCGSFVTTRLGNLYFIHQSAKDYLVLDRANDLFSTGLRQEHGIIANRSLKAMPRNLERDICNLKNPGAPASRAKIGTALKTISYICSFWVDHLANYLEDDTIDGRFYNKYLSDGGFVHRFLLEHLLHWFEALSLIGEVDRGIAGLHILERIISTERLTNSVFKVISNYKAFVHDAVQVFRQFRPAVEEAPLQVYSSILIFSPENSIIHQKFKQEASQWISTLEGHTDLVKSVAFSHDSKLLASASDDRTVRVWDAATGALQQTLEGHTDYINSVAFSHDSKLLASASFDKTVRVWNAATGAL